jgi:uncharacterized membrane protein YcgQ (UPF0703/DUF1980 family)
LTRIHTGFTLLLLGLVYSTNLSRKASFVKRFAFIHRVAKRQVIHLLGRAKDTDFLPDASNEIWLAFGEN